MLLGPSPAPLLYLQTTSLERKMEEREMNMLSQIKPGGWEGAFLLRTGSRQMTKTTHQLLISHLQYKVTVCEPELPLSIMQPVHKYRNCTSNMLDLVSSSVKGSSEADSCRLKVSPTWKALLITKPETEQHYRGKEKVTAWTEAEV